MIYIETGSTDAAFNLAVEYYFAAQKNLGDEIFLFWRTEPTLVIGKFQNAHEEINLSRARAQGVKIVRRLSGGGTIYSDGGNWMFSFIAPGGTGEIRFAEYQEPILRALRELGVPVERNGRNDLVIGGRKFSGNAQYTKAGHTVHHGTLMFKTDVEQMVRLTNTDPQKILSKSIKSVRDRVTNVSEHLPEAMDAEEFKRRIVRSVAGGECEYALSGEDIARIREIQAGMFEGWESVHGAGPKFSIERSARLTGGRMTFLLDVRHGRIERCAVSGDFFGNIDEDAFDAALKGCPYRREDVRKVLEKANLSIYCISAEEMAALIVDE